MCSDFTAYLRISYQTGAPQFTSRVWSAFFRLLNINVSLTSGYHPQSNRQTERLNQELTRFLRTYCQNRQTDWSKYLMWAEYAQSSLQKPATGLTPFKCVLGYQPPLFPWSGEPSNLPSVNEWLQLSEETWNRAHIHLQRAVRRQEETGQPSLLSRSRIHFRPMGLAFHQRHPPQTSLQKAQS